MTKALKDREVDGILTDNFAWTRYVDDLKEESIRVEKEYEHPITYGFVLPGTSTFLTECARRYTRSYNHEMFERIAKYLVPIKVRKLC